MSVKLNHRIFVVGLVLIGLLLGSCRGEEPTPTAVPTDIPAPAPPPTHTLTPIPTPVVGVSVEEQRGESIPISAGGRTIITLDIQTPGDFVVNAGADRGRIIKQAECIYEYTAPDEGGLDTVTFSVTGAGGSAVAQVDFRVISVQILSPEQEVPCPSQLPCGVVVSGSSTGLTDEMQIVVFVNPRDPNIDPWWPYAVSDVDADGNWKREVLVRKEAIFAGYEFAIQALVLPAEQVPVLPLSMDELPAEDDQLGASRIVSLMTVSDRARLGEGRYPGQVTVNSPPNFTRGLPYNEPVEFTGSAEGVPEDLEIWTLVYVHDNGLYYPQNQRICPEVSPAIRTHGGWEAPYTHFGGQGALQYDVVIVVVEPESDASEFFRDYHANGCRTEDFPGIAADVLPRDLREEAAITVVAED